MQNVNEWSVSCSASLALNDYMNPGYLWYFDTGYGCANNMSGLAS